MQSTPRVHDTLLKKTALLASLLLVGEAAVAGEFVATGNMTAPRFDHSATLLDNGKVLIVGGINNMSPTSAELFDPATRTFRPTQGQPLYGWPAGQPGRSYHAAVKLQDGRVLVLGGGNLFAESAGDPAPYAEIYDPSTDRFSATGAMAQERGLFEPVLLADGRVLVAGGRGCCHVEIWTGWGGGSGGDGPIFRSATPLGSIEIYDPLSGTFTLVQDDSSPPIVVPVVLGAPRNAATAIGLADGRVLIAGGEVLSYAPLPGGTSIGYPHYPATADLYDPLDSLSSIVPTASPMSTGRPWAASTLLRNGQVLLTSAAYDAVSQVYLPNAPTELFDPATQLFRSAATPPSGSADQPRRLRSGQIVTLGDGRVLFAGGLIEGEFYGGAPTDDLRADLYDPSTNTFAPDTGTMVTLRYGHTATKLADGRVLITGGINFAGGNFNELASAEIYDPDPIFVSGFEARAVHVVPRSPSGRVNLLSHPNLTKGASGHVVYSTCPEVTGKPQGIRQGSSGTLAPSGFIDPVSKRICYTSAPLFY